MTTPPNIQRDANGFLANYPEFHAWAMKNDRVWSTVNTGLRGCSEAERFVLIAAIQTAEVHSLLKQLMAVNQTRAAIKA